MPHPYTCFVCGKRTNISKKRQRAIALRWIDEQMRRLDTKDKSHFMLLLAICLDKPDGFFLYLWSRVVAKNGDRIEKGDPEMRKFFEDVALEHFERCDPRGLAAVIDAFARKKRKRHRSRRSRKQEARQPLQKNRVELALAGAN